MASTNALIFDVVLRSLKNILSHRALRKSLQEVQARAAAKTSKLLPDADERGEESSEEDDGGEFSDLRWRLICLQPYGHHWQRTTAFAATQSLSKHGDTPPCCLQ